MSSTPSPPSAAACRWSSCPTTRSTGADGPVRLVDVFDGQAPADRLQPHVVRRRGVAVRRAAPASPSQFTRLEFLDNYDARFVIVTHGPDRRGARLQGARSATGWTWYSTADSSFGADVGAPPGGGFAVNVFLRDGDTVYRTWHTDGRGTEQLSHTFALIDLLPVRPPGGVAGLARGLAAVAHLQPVGDVQGHRRALRPLGPRQLTDAPLSACARSPRAASPSAAATSCPWARSGWTCPSAGTPHSRSRASTGSPRPPSRRGRPASPPRASPCRGRSRGGPRGGPPRTSSRGSCTSRRRRRSAGSVFSAQRIQRS